MNRKKLAELNELLQMGLVPKELNFTTEFFLDWSKLQYNRLYDNPVYVMSKFPPQFMNLPGANEIVAQVIRDFKKCKEYKQNQEEEIDIDSL